MWLRSATSVPCSLSWHRTSCSWVGLGGRWFDHLMTDARPFVTRFTCSLWPAHISSTGRSKAPTPLLCYFCCYCCWVQKVFRLCNFSSFCFYVQLFLVLSRPPSLPILILILDWLVLSGNFWFSSDANVPKLHVSTFASLAQKSDKGGWIDLTEKKGCDVAICIVFAEIHKIHKIHITWRPRLQCACIVTYFWQKLISTNNFRLVQTHILPKRIKGWQGGHSLSKKIML